MNTKNKVPSAMKRTRPNSYRAKFRRNKKYVIHSLFNRLLIIIMLLSLTACSSTSSNSTFDLQTYLGNYTGTVEASFQLPGQSQQKNEHSGGLIVQDLAAGQARMHLLFEDNTFILFQGQYDENGMSLSATDDFNFSLMVDPDGNMEGGLNRQDIVITLNGKITGSDCKMEVVFEYLQETANFDAGTILGFRYKLKKS